MHHFFLASNHEGPCFLGGFKRMHHFLPNKNGDRSIKYFRKNQKYFTTHFMMLYIKLLILYDADVLTNLLLAFLHIKMYTMRSYT